jgi:hypothetical protein
VIQITVARQLLWRFGAFLASCVIAITEKLMDFINALYVMKMKYCLERILQAEL